MLRSELQLLGLLKPTVYRFFQSACFGQSRIAVASRTSPCAPDLSRRPFGNSPTRHLGPGGRKVQVQYQGRFLNMASDYSARLTAVHQIRPQSPSPATGKARSDLAKTQLRNYTSRMVSQSVNKTALHPGGVEYVAALDLVVCCRLQKHWTNPISPGRPGNTLSSKKNSTPQLTSTMIVSPSLPTHRYQPCTKMLWSTRLAQPSHRQEL